MLEATVPAQGGGLKIRHVTGTVKISGFHGLRQFSWVKETWGAKQLKTQLRVPALRG